MTTTTERFDPAVSIATIVESKNNPRQTFDPVKFEELRASITAKGIVQPLVGREIKNKIEIVAGARRFRAAKEAGLKTVPMMIRPLSDADVLEIQLIENAMREDVHPLHEGLAFVRLLDLPNYTLGIIAQKTGHTEKHIAQRTRLAKLLPAIAQKFLDGEINIGHANAIARLPEDRQVEAGKLLFIERSGSDTGWKNVKSVRSVPDFEKCIRNELLLDLHAAPWKKDDETLDKQAGSCTACVKRSSAQSILFDDFAKRDVCLDVDCYHRKSKAHLVQVETTLKKTGPVQRIADHYVTPQQQKETGAIGPSDYAPVKKNKPCKSQVKGLYVDGPERGKAIAICTDPKCKVHHRGTLSRAAEAPKKSFWEVRAESLERHIEREGRYAVLQEVIRTAQKLRPQHDAGGPYWKVPHALMQLIAERFVTAAPKGVPDAVIDGLAYAGMVEKFKGNKEDLVLACIASEKGAPAFDHLGGMLVAGMLLNTGLEYCSDYAHGKRTSDIGFLNKSAEILGVDAGAIRKRIAKGMRDEFNAKRKKAEERKAKEGKS